MYVPHVGLVVGWVVGTDVGLLVGLAVGSPDGNAVVGTAVGFDVGSPVGFAVGLVVGSPVGFAVGLVVGSPVGFISKVSFGRDFEQALNFLVEARSAFGNLDSVLQYLARASNSLAMQTHKLVKGKLNRKTKEFVRTCIAYSFITIPSVDQRKDRLQLYLEAGQVALVNSALTQADAIFKQATKLIPEMDPEDEEVILSSHAL